MFQKYFKLCTSTYMEICWNSQAQKPHFMWDLLEFAIQTLWGAHGVKTMRKSFVVHFHDRNYRRNYILDDNTQHQNIHNFIIAVYERTREQFRAYTNFLLLLFGVHFVGCGGEWFFYYHRHRFIFILCVENEKIL